MAWRSDSWQPPLTVKIHYEESYLLTNLLFDCYQAKKKSWQSAQIALIKSILKTRSK